MTERVNSQLNPLAHQSSTQIQQINSADVSKNSSKLKKPLQKPSQELLNSTIIKHTRVPLKNKPYEVMRFKAKAQAKNNTAKPRQKNISIPMPEVLNIVNEIGYDLENDDQQYFWFLKRILVQELPQGWVKETSMMGEAYYHNEQLNVTTFKHPYIKHYRKLFNKIVQNKKYTFHLVREDLEINKTVSTRSKRATFMTRLKQSVVKLADNQIIQVKVYGEQDIKDLKTMLVTLQSKSDQQYQKIAEIQSLSKALTFYEKIVGIDIKKPPYYLKNNPTYLQITPEELIKLGIQYKIDLKTEIDLLWIPRMIQCLPLPPFWKKFQTEFQADQNSLDDMNQQIYYKDLESNTKINFHPSSLFIIKLINKARLDKIDAGISQFLNPKQGNRNGKEKQRKLSSIKANTVALQNIDIKFMDNLNRIYKCSGKDLYEFAYESLNLETKALEDVFEYEQSQADRELILLSEIFQTQVSQFIHEKQLTDYEIRALAEQCKLSASRDTYLYKTLYEFLAQKYQEQDENLKNYESKKTNDSKSTNSDIPKVWIFRQAIEGSYYWIEKSTKEMSTVYPFLRELRRLIEEIKVTNAAVEQYVSTKSQIKVLKKVENYLRLKQYSTCYIDRLIKSNLEDQPAAEYSEDEDKQQEEREFDEQDFLDKVMRDLNIEDDITKEQLLQWMFSWPYEMSDQFFEQKEQIKLKIEEDLQLIREKSLIRKQTLDRMIKKITVINRIGKAFGGKIQQNNIPIMSESAVRKLQEEELLQKIKKTKAVIGVSDIRIRKKLRVLLSNAMQDEQEREKLQGIELLEIEFFESNQKKKQEMLKEQLKKQLGLDVSEIDEDLDEEGSVTQDNIQKMTISEDENEDDSESDNNNNEFQDGDMDEPADDSFTFKGPTNGQEDEKKQDDQDDEPVPEDLHIHDSIPIDMEDKDSILGNIEKDLVNSNLIDETIEQRRKRLENQMIQNKLKELTESSAFIKRVRRKINQQNISKTQDELKKKIIKLKMMHLRVANEELSSPLSINSKHDDFDFLSEIVRVQENVSSSDDSFRDESSVSIVPKISEVDSLYEISHDSEFLEHIQGFENEMDSQMKKEQSITNKFSNKKLTLKENQFYDDFEEIKRIERQINQRRKTGSSGYGKSRMSKNSILYESKESPELRTIKEGSLKRQSSMRLEQSDKSSEAKGIIPNQSPLRISNQNSREQTPLLSDQRTMSRQSSQIDSKGDNSFNINLIKLGQQNRQASFKDINKQKSLSQYSNDLSGNFDSFSERNLPNLESQKSRRNYLTSKLEKVDEEQEMGSRNESKIEGMKSPSLSNPKRSIDSPTRRRLSTQHHINQIRELKRISNSDHNAFIRSQSTKSIKDKSQEILETLVEDDEFERFMNNIKVFKDDIQQDIVEEELDDYSKFILNYYKETVGIPSQTKEQLKLCTKFSQSLNIDSILFTAQKIGIKVLATRETDLLWIAQEFLVHPNPNSLDFQGQKPSENPIEKIKNYYFQQLVQEQRSIRVENISQQVKGPEELEKYMQENSWMTIYEKGEYYKYNFQTKEKELLNLNTNNNSLERRPSIDNTGKVQFQAQMGSGLLSFLRKKGLVVNPPGGLGGILGGNNDQQQNPSQNVGAGQPQVNSISLALGQIKAAIQIQPQGNTDIKDQPIQAVSQAQSDFMRQLMMGQIKTSNVISNFSASQNSNNNFDQQSNDYKLPKRENSQPISVSSDTSRSIQQNYGIGFASQVNIQNRENLKNIDINAIQQYQHQTKKPTEMELLKVQSDIQPQTHYDSVKNSKSNSFFPANIALKSNPSMQDLNSYGLNDETQQYLNNIMKNMEMARTSNMEMRKLASRGLSNISQNQNKRVKVGSVSHKRISNQAQIQQELEFEELIKPVRNIKRIILNPQESYNRMQIQQIEASKTMNDFSEYQHTFCSKFLDKHLSSQYLSPLNDMNQTLENSSNFNSKIFKRLRDNVKLKSMSYLTQRQFQERLDRVQEETEFEKDAYQKKLDMAQSIVSTIPYNYNKLLRDSQTLRQDFLFKTAQKGIVIDTRQRILSQQSKRLQINGSQSARELNIGNNFRNMSPKSLVRWGMKSNLNYQMAKKTGIIRSTQSKTSYSKLRRNQEDKMVFSKVQL
ncbi:ww domain containing protein [Stylonychia lemnae]|uniref:Ww domain containing protein n=1 Tax=Stylonychia lemnae TaxID=5949 RepID=A0A077ZPT6_STYLE|nr:ww domain containing protein [Stylonychia lemnae]|eukprot:CDW71972.1 ww domain containing protein [Stylonychia lemnae]